MIYTKEPQGTIGIRLSDLLLLLGATQQSDPGTYLRVLEEFFHTFSLHGVQSNTIPPCFFKGLQALRETHEEAPKGLEGLMPLIVFLKRCRMMKKFILGPVGWSEACRLYKVSNSFIDPKVGIHFLTEGQETRRRERNATFMCFDASFNDGVGGYFNPVSARFVIDDAVRLVYEGKTPLGDHFHNQDDYPVKGYLLFPSRKGKEGVVPIGTLRIEEGASSYKTAIASEITLRLEAEREQGAWLVVTRDRFDSAHRFNPKNKQILLSPLPDIVTGAPEYVFQNRNHYLTYDGIRQFVQMPSDLVIDLMTRYPNICVGEDFISIAIKAYERKKILHFMTDAPGSPKNVVWPKPNWEPDYEKEYKIRMQRICG